MPTKSGKRRPLRKTRSRCGGTTPTRKRNRTPTPTPQTPPSTPKTSPSSPTEIYIPSPNEPSPETQRKEVYEEYDRIARKNEEDRKRQRIEYEKQKARGVKTPPTVITNQKGHIMYIQNEDGTGYREATSSDPNEGIYYIRDDGSGPTFNKSGIRVKPLPLPSLQFSDM